MNRATRRATGRQAQKDLAKAKKYKASKKIYSNSLKGYMARKDLGKLDYIEAETEITKVEKDLNCRNGNSTNVKKIPNKPGKVK